MVPESTAPSAPASSAVAAAAAAGDGRRAGRAERRRRGERSGEQTKRNAGVADLKEQGKVVNSLSFLEIHSEKKNLSTETRVSLFFSDRQSVGYVLFIISLAHLCNFRNVEV